VLLGVAGCGVATLWVADLGDGLLAAVAFGEAVVAATPLDDAGFATVAFGEAALGAAPLVAAALRAGDEGGFGATAGFFEASAALALGTAFLGGVVACAVVFAFAISGPPPPGHQSQARP
jgi:pyruvate/2-oxoglutarate/acetoin dehydrogenase E1 component